MVVPMITICKKDYVVDYCTKEVDRDDMILSATGISVAVSVHLIAAAGEPGRPGDHTFLLAAPTRAFSFIPSMS